MSVLEADASPLLASQDARSIPHTEILGVPVSQLTLERAVRTVLEWTAQKRANFVCIRDVHGIMHAVKSKELRDLHWRAGMVTPDGMPLVWISRARGRSEVSRVCGPDFLEAVCAASVATQTRHYFYGGKPGIAERLALRLSQRYPGLNVVGVSTPPFRALTPAEDAEETKRIAEAAPDVVWVGLSTPKQEFWMQQHLGRIPGATLIGVGAAFDFHAGAVERAPVWMQHSGLEWLHRLTSEPGRLWRRYLLLAPQFVFLAALELAGVRPFPVEPPSVETVRANPPVRSDLPD